MAFDPTKPANNSPISSAELRAQFVELNNLIATRAALPGDVRPLSASVSEPMTVVDLLNVINKVNELIAALKA
jgi:hypothetical protein